MRCLLAVLCLGLAVAREEAGVAEHVDEQPADHTERSPERPDPRTTGVGCNVGTYYWGAFNDKHYCVKCPPGTTSKGCGLLPGWACPVDPYHKSCNIKTDGVVTIDKKCPPGTSIDKTSDTGCVPCGAGTYNAATYNVESCTPCEAGTFQAEVGALSCFKCAIGTFAAAPGSTSCTKCPVCPVGSKISTAAPGASAATACGCTTCDRGTYTAPGYTKCFDCTPGRFQNRKGGATCKSCAVGQYQGLSGAKTCFNCPQGKTTKEPATRSLAECALAVQDGTVCAAGTHIFYEPKTEAVYCRNCGAGRYGAHNADNRYGGMCYDCAAGEYQPFEGRTSCFKCPAGTEPSPTRAKCAAVATGAPTEAPTSAPTTEPACKTSTWGGWSACSAECGTGSQKRSRTVTPATDGQTCAEASEEVEPCTAASPCPGDPVDCVYGKWTVETTCAQKCDSEVTDTATWTRTGTPPKNGGKACGALKLIKACNPFPCPVHCDTSDWSGWSACSATCGDGEMTNTRTVTVAAANGGKICPELKKTKPCFAGACPIDCVMSDWSDYGTCTMHCGPGLQYRTRDVEVSPAPGGKACGPTVQARACTIKPCPNDCIMGVWGGWSACSDSCTTGSRTRHREVQRYSSGGVGCGARTQTVSCFVPCPVHCVMTAFTDWSSCSRTCGTGYTRRTRRIATKPSWGGDACGSTLEVQSCNTDACPVDCVMEPWGSYGVCGKACGWSSQLRVRSIQRDAEFGGKPCESSTGSKVCKIKDCPVACKYSDWSDWSPCSTTCGAGGSHTRLRSILAEAKHDGTACDKSSLVETKTCDSLSPCPVKCAVSQWGAWDTCSATCWDGGHQTRDGPTQKRKRTVTTKSYDEDTVCPSLEETRFCNKGILCPIDCKYSSFSEWTKCSRDCGTGYQARFRTITQHNFNKGVACPHLREERKCNTSACPVNCVMSAWSVFDNCSKECGGGKQVRRRSIDVEGAHGGVSCTSKPKTDEQPCNTQKCKVDCKLGEWGGFGPCSHKCGGGEQRRFRKILLNAGYGGKTCEHLVEALACNEHECPIDCKVGPPSTWSTCSKKCGGGTQTRTRPITQVQKHGGSECPQTEYTQPCNTSLCPVDCELTAWSTWTNCDAKCGDGKRHAFRTIKVHPAFGGKKCDGAMTKAIDCNLGLCPENCTVDEFGSWSVCVAPSGKSCGPGSRERTRNIVKQGHQSVCPHLKEAEPCLVDGIQCPEDCATSAWSEWDVCTASCGGGVQDRYRAIVSPARFNGKTCGEVNQRRKCNLQNCVVDEVVGQWGEWDACSEECGGGHQQRRRQTTTAAEFGGVELANEEGRVCNTQPCAIDCVFGAWGAWSACSKSCGGGTKSRFRGIKTPAAYGGKCDTVKTTKQRECKKAECPIDCKLGAWTTLSDCSRSCGVGTRQSHALVISKAQFGGRGCTHPLVTVKSVTGTNGLTKEVSSTEQMWELKFPKCMTEVIKYCNDKAVNCNTKSVYDAAQNSLFGENTTVCPATTSFDFFAFSEKTVIMAVNRYKCDAGPCPVHCSVSEWGTWGACSAAKCGGGTQVRTRTVLQANEAGGSQCPNLAEPRKCNEDPCPIDCRLSSWGKWSTCSAVCGGGRQSRTRSMISAADHGGKDCASEDEGKDCNTMVCAADCQLSSWGSFFPLEGCTKKCGGGNKWRFKSVVSEAAGSGKPCSDMQKKETLPCNQQACDVDCVLSQWTSFSECTASCGTGSQFRSRVAQVLPRLNGKACDAKVEQAACNTHHCPVDCVPQAWHLSAWSSCSETCGWGTRTRTRVPVVNADHGGRECAPATMMAKQRCHLINCPVHCEISGWGTWSDCSQTCAEGFKKRARVITQQPRFGGRSCTGHLLEDTDKCNNGICPINCEVEAWGSWGACMRGGKVATCGGGTITRTRKVATHGTTLTHGIGRICPFLTETNSCATNYCAVDCIPGEWGSWSNCNRACDGGVERRTRKPTRWQAHGGKVCASLSEERACNTQVCPVNCEYSFYSPWTPCSAECGGGWSFSRRSVNREAQGSGRTCDTTTLLREKTCNVKSCHSAEKKCHMLFAKEKDEATAKGAGCFDFLKAKLVAGYTTQGTSSGSCLWTYYTPMDIRHFCPEEVLTAATVESEYPQCTTLLLATCHAGRFDCHTKAGSELAQGKVWNQFKTTPEQGCPSPSEFKMTLHGEFKDNLASNVDINTASKSELETLYGIGNAKANRIINYRSTFGSFTTVADLAKVSYISTNTVNTMIEHAGATNGKPVVTSEQAAGVQHCKFGETKFINWFEARKSSSDVEGLAQGRIRLANSKYGEVSGNVDLGASGPWALKFTSYSSGSDERAAGDEAILTINDVAKSVRNDGVSHDISQTIVGNAIDYHFAFRSLNDKAARHMAIHNAEITCVAEPTECVMEEWGTWSACSRECNHEVGDGGGLRYRARNIKVPALFGGACAFSRQQRQRCNDHPCPWSRAYEAEDAALKGCALFDNKVYTKAVAPRSSFKGSGYVSMDGDGACRTSASTISWKVEVPKHGRYQLQFRYAVDGTKSHVAKLNAITNDQVIVDNQFAQAIEFPATTGAGFDNWYLASVDVEFYAGVNTVVIETVPHGDDGSKPHLDRLVVTQLKELERCIPGSMVPIKWADVATSSSIVSKTTDGVRMGPAFSGKISGSIDLGAMGPWSIQMQVDTTPVHEVDSMAVFINKANKANLRSNTGVRTVVVPVSHATAQFSFQFEAMSQAPASHMNVHNGVAVCQGCSDVTCKKQELPAFISGHKTAGFKIEVSHPQGKTAGNGSHGAGEMHGNHHKCAWNNQWDACQCSCSVLNHQVTRYAMCRASENKYRVTSRYTDASAQLKYTERCESCPAGKFVAANNQNKCQWKAQDLYKDSSVQCTDNVNTATPCLNGAYLAGVSSTGGQSCCKRLAQDKTPLRNARTCYTPNFWDGFISNGASTVMTAQCKNGFHLTGLPKMPQCTAAGSVNTHTGAGSENVMCCKEDAPNATDKCHWSTTNSCASADTGYVMAGVRYGKGTCRVEAVKCCFALGASSA